MGNPHPPQERSTGPEAAAADGVRARGGDARRGRSNSAAISAIVIHTYFS